MLITVSVRPPMVEALTARWQKHRAVSTQKSILRPPTTTSRAASPSSDNSGIFSATPGFIKRKLFDRWIESVHVNLEDFGLEENWNLRRDVSPGADDLCPMVVACCGHGTQAVKPPRSSFVPLATNFNAPSGSGRCSASAISKFSPNH